MKKTEHKKGFTLIETFVAITILLIAILGPLSLFSKYFTDVDYVRRQNTATFLAQEGVELMMFQREVNMRAGQPGFTDWSSYLGRWFSLPAGVALNGWTRCTESGNTNEVSPPQSADDCPPLKYDQSLAKGYYYNSDIGVNSSYIRAIFLTPIPASNPIVIKVKVNVYWTTRGGAPQNTPIETYLYDI